MAVRNFWIEAAIDGRKTRLRGGPVSKDGGFSLTIYQRSNGGIVRALVIEGMVASRPAGLLRLLVYESSKSNPKVVFETIR